MKTCFKAFADAFMLRFDDCRSLKIGFVGSVAFHFSEVLAETMADFGLTLGEVLKAPADGLVRYYI